MMIPKLPPMLLPPILPIPLPTLLTPRHAQALGNVEEHVDAIVHAREDLLAGTLGEDRDVGEGVHALVGAGGEGAVDDEAAEGVFRVNEEVFFVEAGDVCCWGLGVKRMLALYVGGCGDVVGIVAYPGAVLVHLVVLPVVGVGAEALSQGDPRAV